MSSFSRRITEVLIAGRWPLLAAAVVLAAVAFRPARDLYQYFDRSIENMFAPDDPLLPPFQRLKRTFGGDEIVLAVYTDDELLHPDGRGIERLAKISRTLKDVPGVRDVISLDLPLGLAVVDRDNSLSEKTLKLFEGYTHGADGRTVSVVCMLHPEDKLTETQNEPTETQNEETETKNEKPQTRKETIEQMRKIMDEQGGTIAGEPVMVTDGFDHVEQDGRRLGRASLILLAITIIVCFRSLRWVIIPIAVVQLTLLITQATLVWTKLQLSMVSSMLTAIVTVVGIATVVHVIVRFREARLDGLDPRGALTRAGTILVAPVFWACSTDAVGFAALTTASVGPVQDFGLMMAIGSMFVLVSAALLVPGLALLGWFDTDPKRAWGERLLDVQLAALARAVRRRPKTIGLVALAATVVAAAGVFRLEVESDFTRNFRANSPIVRSYEFVENNLGGAGVWDVVVPAPAPEDLDWKYLRRVRRLEDRLREEVPQLTKVISIPDAVVAGSVVDLDKVRMSLIRENLLRAGLTSMRRKIPVLLEALYGEDPQNPGRHYMRIMLRARERQPSHEKRKLIEKAEAIAREEVAKWNGETDEPSADTTGFFVLLTSLIDSMIRDQWTTFGIATLGIALMMLAAFRSPVLAVVALAPNAMPILFVLGLMGWLGLKINMGAAMIAAVSMGLSIDSSIHYITSFRRARKEGKSASDAIDQVQQTVGRAMVFSTLALIVGFSVLCRSQFVPTIYFGMLVSLSMLGGLAGNLVVLPLLLQGIGSRG